MNAADLMLGDYIQIEDEEGNLITDYICDIGYVPQWNELGVRTCKCGDEWLRESEIIPIPLTEEILTRNFPNYKEIVWFLLDTLPGYFNIYWEYPSFGDGEIRLNIQYVHELQHILKLCNINKEIEL